jgi:hypothetical protein
MPARGPEGFGPPGTYLPAWGRVCRQVCVCMCVRVCARACVCVCVARVRTSTVAAEPGYGARNVNSRPAEEAREGCRRRCGATTWYQAKLVRATKRVRRVAGMQQAEPHAVRGSPQHQGRVLQPHP